MKKVIPLLISKGFSMRLAKEYLKTYNDKDLIISNIRHFSHEIRNTIMTVRLESNLAKPFTITILKMGCLISIKCSEYAIGFLSIDFQRVQMNNISDFAAKSKLLRLHRMYNDNYAHTLKLLKCDPRDYTRGDIVRINSDLNNL